MIAIDSPSLAALSGCSVIVFGVLYKLYRVVVEDARNDRCKKHDEYFTAPYSKIEQVTFK